MTRENIPDKWVLVVDDMKTHLDVMKQIMSLYGINIDCVTCGKDAIRLIRSGVIRYDMVFMDHLMPEIDGIKTTKIIREAIGTEYAKSVPIIALTASTENEKLFLENGFQGYLAKPINIKELDPIINKWLSGQTGEITFHTEERKQPVNQDGLDKLNGFSVKGIDFTEAIERYNDEEAYINMLRSFHLHTPDILEKLKRFSGKDHETLDEYRILMHGLKGVSYGICAKEIGDEAKKLENAAKTGNIKEIFENNAFLIKKTEALLADLGEVLKKTANTEVKPHLFAPDSKLLIKLLYAARIYRASAMWSIIKELESFEYTTGNELVAWLHGKMDIFEYDAIQRRIKNEFANARR